MSDLANLRIDTADAVTRIVIDRPKVNALDRTTLESLSAALDRLDASTRVVILAGGGARAFVAGADIAAMVDLRPEQARAFSRLGHEVFARLEALDQPTIAEVQGFALGGGCELMLACDFAIASDRALIGVPEVTIGVLPGFGGTYRLARKIGPAAARQMMFTGAPVKADEALRLGLVNEVVAPEQLTARVDEIAQQIAKNAPRAVALAKRSARVGEGADPETAARYEQEVFGLCFSTDDQTEGMRAFLDKRSPTWKGE